MFNERMEAEAQLRSPPQQQQPPSPKKSRAQTAGQSPKKRTPGSVVTGTTVQTIKTTSLVGGPISKAYEARGLTEIQVENEHLRTVDVEVKRERTVTQSV